MQAEAVVFTAPNQVEFKTVECPEPEPDELVIRMKHSWISPGTEGSFLRGERIGGDTPYYEGGPWPFPIILGYQAVGVVEYVGPKVGDFQVGDRVFTDGGRVKNMYRDYGGHISLLVTSNSRKNILKLPETPEALSFSGLLLTQVGYNSGSRAPIMPGEYALIAGDGLVGQWAAQTLTWRGAKVIMLGEKYERLNIAGELTGCTIINIKKTDWVSEVERITSGSIAMAVDAAGSVQFTEDAIQVMRRFGHIVSAGFCGNNDQFHLQHLRDKELTLHSVAGCVKERLQKTLELIADGTLKTLPLITHHFPAHAAAKAWDVIRDCNTHSLGVVLDW